MIAPYPAFEIQHIWGNTPQGERRARGPIGRTEAQASGQGSTPGNNDRASCFEENESRDDHAGHYDAQRALVQIGHWCNKEL